jgi:hypothetical protein
MNRASRLDSLRIVTPCTVPWSSMNGDDAVRFCAKCRKNVYNVAALDPAEALALVERAEGRVCMQLTRRTDGTVVTGDCWAQLRRARKRGLLALAVAAPAILATQLWSQAFGLRALSEIFDRSAPMAVAGAAAVAEPHAPGGVALPAPVDPPPLDRHVLKGEISARPRVAKKHPRPDLKPSSRGAVVWSDDVPGER